MQGRDLDAALQQLAHDGIHFSFRQDDIAHGHGAILGGLECDPTSQCQCRFDGDTVEGHLQVAPGNAIAVNFALDGSGFSESYIDLAPLNFGRTYMAGERHG